MTSKKIKIIYPIIEPPAQHLWRSIIETLDYQHRIKLLETLNKKDFILYKQLIQSCFIIQYFNKALQYTLLAMNLVQQNLFLKNQFKIQIFLILKIAVQSLGKIKYPHFYFIDKVQRLLRKYFIQKVQRKIQNNQDQDNNNNQNFLNSENLSEYSFTSLYQQLLKFINSNKNTAFLYYLRKNGAEFPKIDLIQQQDNPQYRKIVSSKKIQKDQVILFIPKKFLITLEMTKTSKLVKKLFQRRTILCSPKHCLLSIFLLQHKQMGLQSPFCKYIQMLPEKYDTFPINYTQQQMKQLQGSSFYLTIQQKIADIKKDYETICEVDMSDFSPISQNHNNKNQNSQDYLIKQQKNDLPQKYQPSQITTKKLFNRFSLQQFKWARMTISSRIFGIIMNNCKTDALVPLADMLNHQSPKQTNWYYSNQDNGFIIRSLKSTQSSFQIYDSYGMKCNSRFLLNYGFTIPNNSANQVIFLISLIDQNKDRNKSDLIDRKKQIEFEKQKKRSKRNDKCNQNQFNRNRQRLSSTRSSASDIQKQKSMIANMQIQAIQDHQQHNQQESSRQKQEQAQIQNDAPIQTIPKQLFVKGNRNLLSKQFQDLMGIVRYVCMTPQELKNHRQQSKLLQSSEKQIKNSLQISQKAQTSPFISYENQIKAWKKIEQLSLKQMNQYPTTLRQDKKIISAHNNKTQVISSINKYNCIILRMGQKQVLNCFLVMSRKMVKFINLHRDDKLHYNSFGKNKRNLLIIKKEEDNMETENYFKNSNQKIQQNQKKNKINIPNDMKSYEAYLKTLPIFENIDESQ